ncbi:hypothetical protein [Ralstonia sp. NT80]|uniref:hypothetical protein n=1 Tax=Ralstonia sp. NT80 TaxID=1218247 RepID=UPI0035B66AC4
MMTPESEGSYIVTPAAQRPASMNGKCFYCGQRIGERHKGDCVLIKKTVHVRLAIEYTVEVPADWGKDLIEFQRNEGSWCANNLIDELAEFADGPDGCLCRHAEFTYIEDVSGPVLKEE